MEICTEFNQNPSGNIEGPQLITTFTEPIIMKLVHSRRRFFKKSYAKIHEYSANVLAGDKSHVVEQKDRERSWSVFMASIMNNTRMELRLYYERGFLLVHRTVD